MQIIELGAGNKWWIRQIQSLPTTDTNFTYQIFTTLLFLSLELYKISLSQPPISTWSCKQSSISKLKNGKFALSLKGDRYNYLHHFLPSSLDSDVMAGAAKAILNPWSKNQKSQKGSLILWSLWNITSSLYLCNSLFLDEENKSLLIQHTVSQVFCNCIWIHSNGHNWLDEVIGLSGETDIINLFHRNCLLGIVTKAVKANYRVPGACVTGLSDSKVCDAWE